MGDDLQLASAKTAKANFRSKGGPRVAKMTAPQEHQADKATPRNFVRTKFSTSDPAGAPAPCPTPTKPGPRIDHSIPRVKYCPPKKNYFRPPSPTINDLTNGAKNATKYKQEVTPEGERIIEGYRGNDGNQKAHMKMTPPRRQKKEDWPWRSTRWENPSGLQTA